MMNLMNFFKKKIILSLVILLSIYQRPHRTQSRLLKHTTTDFSEQAKTHIR